MAYFPTTKTNQQPLWQVAITLRPCEDIYNIQDGHRRLGKGHFERTWLDFGGGHIRPILLHKSSCRPMCSLARDDLTPSLRLSRQRWNDTRELNANWNGFLVRSGDDRRSDDAARHIASLFVDELLRDGLRQSVRVWPAMLPQKIRRQCSQLIDRMSTNHNHNPQSILCAFYS